MAQSITKKAITKKVIFLIAAVVIGGGAIAFGMMAQPDDQVTANATSDTKTDESEVKVSEAVSTDGFLNRDMVVGDKDAPIEIIEYAAISCSHCAHFHADILPKLKKKYLDTGKAKLVYRNFIFDNPFDAYASALTRCVSEEKFFPTVKTFFDYQNVWFKGEEMMKIFEKDGREAAINFAKSEVMKTGKMAGITNEEAKKCMTDNKVLNYLLTLRAHAVEKYKITGTPTIIVNGKALDNYDFETIDKAIGEATK